MSEELKLSLPRRRERSREAGEQRVRIILDAVVQIIGTKGLQAVTHRAVAGLAGVPLGSMTYYFRDLDDVIEQAMLYAIEVEGERLLKIAQSLDGDQAATIDSAVDLITQMFFDKTVADPLYDIALFELFMEATRRPEVRPLTLQWSEMIGSLLDHVLPPTDPMLRREDVVQLVATSIDGLMLEETSNQTLGLDGLSSRIRTLLERFVIV